MKRYDILSSPSELRLKVYGASVSELFLHALQAMFENAGPQFVEPAEEVSRELALQSTDIDTLLVDFLSDALTLASIHNEAYTDASIYVESNQKIRATLTGLKVCAFEIELKAVTYHGVLIIRSEAGYSTEITVDI